MSDFNPIEVQRYLGGVDYPASKQTIIEAAEDSGAGDDVLEALERLPERDYDDSTEVSSALSGS
jgi:hypothetical protein